MERLYMCAVQHSCDSLFFFFQAEDGIRDLTVTGVQTCALPIYAYLRTLLTELGLEKEMAWVETRTGFYTDGTLYSMSNTLEFLRFPPLSLFSKIGRASCRERV